MKCFTIVKEENLWNLNENLSNKNENIQIRNKIEEKLLNNNIKNEINHKKIVDDAEIDKEIIFKENN